MHFDLADLRLFIHIAESPSLTQGARRAFLSPFPRRSIYPLAFCGNLSCARSL